MSPRVTVLLAVRNGGAFLGEAVESVLAQTYENFELLLVDDASTDDAMASLPADPRIRVFRNERNVGQIPSLNRGLAEARGEYIARLDHDDVCLPRRLELQMGLLDAQPQVALVSSWVDIVETNGRLWTHVRTDLDSFEEFAALVVTARLVLVHPSLMFRRSVIREVGGFDERLGAAEDQELYRRLVLAGQEARVVPQTLLRYRRHEEQMTYAKAAMVRENDARSHERFLAALAPRLPAETLRQLFAAERSFWEETTPSPELLDGFLAAAVERLGLAGPPAVDFAAALAQSAASCLLAGWAAGVYDGRARPLASFARRHGEPHARAIGALERFLAATAPAGRPVAAVRSRTRRALRSELLDAPRRTARRSRALRRLYTRVVDARGPED